MHIEDGELSKGITVKDKKGSEQLNMCDQLDEEEKSTVFKIIDTMLTKKKFKDFLQKNIAAL